jgi:hypothetical protein
MPYDDPAPVQPSREVQPPPARELCDGYHFISSESDIQFCRQELRRRLARSRQIAMPAPPPVNDPPLPPLRPVDPDPPAPAPRLFPMPSTPLTPPADATECWGYWRICHFY